MNDEVVKSVAEQRLDAANQIAASLDRDGAQQAEAAAEAESASSNEGAGPADAAAGDAGKDEQTPQKPRFQPEVLTNDEGERSIRVKVLGKDHDISEGEMLDSVANVLAEIDIPYEEGVTLAQMEAAVREKLKISGERAHSAREVQEQAKKLMEDVQRQKEEFEAASAKADPEQDFSLLDDDTFQEEIAYKSPEEITKIVQERDKQRAAKEAQDTKADTADTAAATDTGGTEGAEKVWLPESEEEARQVLAEPVLAGSESEEVNKALTSWGTLPENRDIVGDNAELWDSFNAHAKAIEAQANADGRQITVSELCDAAADQARKTVGTDKPSEPSARTGNELADRDAKKAAAAARKTSSNSSGTATADADEQAPTRSEYIASLQRTRGSRGAQRA